jgi:hypothetical protein
VTLRKLPELTTCYGRMIKYTFYKEVNPPLQLLTFVVGTEVKIPRSDCPYTTLVATMKKAVNNANFILLLCFYLNRER